MGRYYKRNKENRFAHDRFRNDWSELTDQEYMDMCIKVQEHCAKYPSDILKYIFYKPA